MESRWIRGYVKISDILKSTIQNVRFLLLAGRLLGSFSEERLFYPLVEQHGQNGNNSTLEKVHGSHGEKDEGRNTGNVAVDGGTGSNNGINGHVEQLCKFGD